MADDAAESMMSELDLPDPIAGLQAQIDDLTAVLEHHQRLLERLQAQGLLADAGDGQS